MTYCRITGLNYVEGSPEDEAVRRKLLNIILKGGYPKDVRDFMKDFGWACAYNDGGIARKAASYTQGDRARYPGKRNETARAAVVFGYFARARAMGLPDKEAEAYLLDRFRMVDLKVDLKTNPDKEKARAEIQHIIARWDKYDA
jgi:hypothetical protein